MSAGDVVLVIMAIVMPPLAVAIKSGLCSGAFFLNLLLTILAYLPGVLHAWWIILRHPEVVIQCQHQQDLERNRVTGTFPGQTYQPLPQAAPRVAPNNQIKAAPEQGNMAGVYAQNNYGTIEQQPPAYAPISDNKNATA